MEDNRCVVCNEIIPEGMMVCPICESRVNRDPSRTKGLLRQYRDMEYKAKNAQEIIRECDAMMTSMAGFSSSTPVQGGGNKREDMMIRCIDRKAQVEYALLYMEMMDRAINHLTDSERELIMDFYIDRYGIRWICRKYHLGKSRAYQICNNALLHLDSLLF